MNPEIYWTGDKSYKPKFDIVFCSLLAALHKSLISYLFQYL